MSVIVDNKCVFVLDLPPDSLDGHRDRFYLQHKRLKTFCFEAAALSYVTNLTPIPNIPEVYNVTLFFL